MKKTYNYKLLRKSELGDFFVEYIDEHGLLSSDTWSEWALLREIEDGIVKIVSIKPAYFSPEDDE